MGLMHQKDNFNSESSDSVFLFDSVILILHTPNALLISVT
jgi:hypothetical protein